MILNVESVLRSLLEIHRKIRQAVLGALGDSSIEASSAVVGQEGGDTIFAVDRISERVLVECFDEFSRRWPCVLIAEGLGSEGSRVLPAGMEPHEATLRVIVDPIDGTRGLMYQKRSAWILTGVAPNQGEQTCLADIELAVQTEIPLLKQYLCDTLWAVAGSPVQGERLNLLTGEKESFSPRPSRAASIAQGFGTVARFFPGMREELAAVDDLLVERILGPVRPGEASVFEDQYISTGGQLYELMVGHDRWVADLRPLVGTSQRRRGKALGLCCHPYDICTELVARQAGVIVTDVQGRPLAAPLDVATPVAWVGYANEAIRQQVEPVLQAILRERGWINA